MNFCNPDIAKNAWRGRITFDEPYLRPVNFCGMKIFVTDKDILMDDLTLLSYNVGYWTNKGEIYVWKPGLTWLQRFGFVAHECLEYLMVRKLGMNEKSKWPHRFCCFIEVVLTLGRAIPVLYWR
jgi:hypothetical protein